MPNKVARPTDPYDPLWTLYRAQNPGLRLSLSAADPDEGGGGDQGPDLSFIPETFKGEDGAYKLTDFSDHYSELAAFKSQADEAAAALPEGPDGYEWGVSEDYEWPEGFDPNAFMQPVLEDGKPVIGEDGKPQQRALEISDILSTDDPDIPVLQDVLHKAGAKPELAKTLAGIMVNRELRAMQDAGNAAAEQRAALGPNAQSRIDVVTRSLNAKLPAAQATALLNGIDSADALRAVEAMIKNSNIPPGSAHDTKLDNSTASIDERIAAGLKQRQTG